MRKKAKYFIILTFTFLLISSCDKENVIVSDPRVISGSEGNSFHAEWSPDGVNIVYDRGGPGDHEILIIPAAGGTPTQLTDDDYYNVAPDYSPDGSEIYFHSNRSGFIDIYKIDAAGGPATALTDDPYQNQRISLNPDGTMLCFDSNRGGTGFFDVWVMNTTGDPDFRRITTAESNDEMAHWSRNGDWITFTSSRTGNMELFIIPADGGETIRITDHQADDRHPNWGPSDEWILFDSDRSGNFDIYAIHLETGTIIQITDDPASDKRASYSPAADMVVFDSDRSGERVLYTVEVNWPDR